jgi:hypothetical protein
MPVEVIIGRVVVRETPSYARAAVGGSNRACNRILSERQVFRWSPAGARILWTVRHALHKLCIAVPGSIGSRPSKRAAPVGRWAETGHAPALRMPG